GSRPTQNCSCKSPVCRRNVLELFGESSYIIECSVGGAKIIRALRHRLRDLEQSDASTFHLGLEIGPNRRLRRLATYGNRPENHCPGRRQEKHISPVC